MSEFAEKREIELVAQIEERHRQPDLCTIYVADDDEHSRMSTWITAEEGSFVKPQSVR